jgi:hypothetical protein
MQNQDYSRVSGRTLIIVELWKAERTNQKPKSGAMCRYTKVITTSGCKKSFMKGTNVNLNVKAIMDVKKDGSTNKNTEAKGSLNVINENTNMNTSAKTGMDTHVKKVNTANEEDRTRHFAINYEHSKKSMKVYAVN